MKDVLSFLIEAGKLKKMPRTGFVWLEVENPETIGQHVFRVAVMSWILGERASSTINLEKIIKIGLVHDLCEVYAGDMTPYWGLLPEDKEKRKEVLKRWIRLPQAEKMKRDKEKFRKEKESIVKLLKHLEPKLEKEIMDYWLEYERLTSEEGRFVKQNDKIETLLQALKYWGTEPDTPVLGWWEEVKELVDAPFLLDFLRKIEEFFYEEKRENGELKFLLEVGKLKTKQRTGWVIRKIKNPETIAEHSFLFAIASWVLGHGRNLNLEKVLKMSLVYELCEVYAGDVTPYRGLLADDEKEEILQRWPRFLKKEKEERFDRDYKEEKRALQKVTSGLPVKLRKEIISLWDECKRKSTFEGKFVNQVYWLTTYLQALQYFEKDEEFPIKAWYEQMREYIEDELLLELMREMENKFLKT